MIKDTDVLIIGGAVSGASLACGLARYNIKTVVIDRRKEPAGLNRGDGLHPRTQEILSDWGILDNFSKVPHVRSYGIEVRHPSLGKLITLDLKGLDSVKFNYIMCIPHQKIEETFLGCARSHPNIEVLQGYSLQKLQYDSNGIVSGAIIRGADGTIEYKTRLVVGADGGQSLVRKELCIPTQKKTYNHELIVVHMPRPHWFQEELRTRVYLHRSGAVVLLPLPEGRMRVAVVMSPGKAAEWKRLSNKELSDQLSERLPLLNNLPISREGEHLYRMTRMHAENYVAKGAVLIGDSAHLTHASSGQGMNMAIQDADVLSTAINQFLNGEMSREFALQKYERIRRPINEEIIERSNFMASAVFTPEFHKHTMKVSGLYSMRFIPGLRARIGTRIAKGISGVNQIAQLASH